MASTSADPVQVIKETGLYAREASTVEGDGPPQRRPPRFGQTVIGGRRLRRPRTHPSQRTSTLADGKRPEFGRSIVRLTEMVFTAQTAKTALRQTPRSPETVGP